MRQRLARLFVLALLGLASCDAAAGPALDVARRLPVPAAAATLFADAEGGLWLGAPGELLRVDSSGAVARLPLGKAPPRVIATAGSLLLVRSGERLLALDPRSPAPPASREAAGGAVLLDVRQRFLVWSDESGAVLGLDVRTLEPRWIWASLGRATAAALSPEGDRVYQAVASGEDAWSLVARDLQNGRAVWEEELSAPASALHAGPGGELVALVGDPGEEAVLRLHPAGAALRPGWRVRLRALGLAAPVEVRVSAGGSVALFSPGSDAGLRVLDAETGDVLGVLEAPVRDAAFGGGGPLLYVLTGAEVRVARVPR